MKRTLKKLLALALSAAVCAGLLAGCGSFSASDLVKSNLDLIYLDQYTDDYLKKGSSQCYFLIYHKNSVLQPKKIQDYFVKENPAGINGALLEGRFLYDAFVLGARSDGVYACVAASTKQATPTFAYSGGVLTITSAGATEVRVTLDGSDPRFSKDAIKTTSGGTVTLPSGKTKAKAVAFDDALFTSEVATDSERTGS